MPDALKFITSWVLPPMYVAVAMSVLSAVLDLSIPWVSASAAFGVAILYWARDHRRAIADRASQPG